MTKRDVEVEIETLTLAVQVNQGFLNLVPKGSDKRTEKQVEVDRKKIAELRTKLEAM
jgi:hypothetical protein